IRATSPGYSDEIYAHRVRWLLRETPLGLVWRSDLGALEKILSGARSDLWGRIGEIAAPALIVRGAHVYLAAEPARRLVDAGDDGTFVMENLPRGARLATTHKYYGRNDVGAEVPELRLVPLTITFEVHDSATGRGIDTPEARQPDDVQVGKGSASGEMVVGPY